ncbi:DUF2259 domain-containing protein [Desulfonema ishimotonii]|uniref:DUF2259 domain-containing protein n=1 Tax=Desulfonema ishimotonii TaxID=45657 RepID=A0A401FWB3_9BACT|nr:DUF2259 domain-containing protein [Desulfonema ishimotonii]GBC61256.1 DUF2259 domain-containing protein [Desulfonema ishimotonii]
MKVKILMLMIFVCFMVCPPTWGSDVYKLNFIGFSENGEFLAFENEPHLMDSEAGKHAIFIDVLNNKYVGPVLYRQSDIDKKIKELEIKKGNTGKQVIHHPPSDMGVNPHNVKFTTFQYQLGTKDKYELELKLIQTLSKECEIYKAYAGPGINMIELKLINQEKDEIILQKDNSLPKTRDCAFKYRIEDVYTYRGKIAVFIQVFTPSIEGPTRKYMIVTGKLN